MGLAYKCSCGHNKTNHSSTIKHLDGEYDGVKYTYCKVQGCDCGLYKFAKFNKTKRGHIEYLNLSKKIKIAKKPNRIITMHDLGPDGKHPYFSES